MGAQAGLQVVLAVDAIHRPLTGIGRYAWELCQGLTTRPEIQSLKFLHHGRWLADPAQLLASRSLLSGGRMRKLLAGSRLMTAAYTQVMPRLQGRRLRRHPEYLFHSPGFFLPPFAGRSVATFHDLSFLEHPEFHPPARVAMLKKEIPKTLRRADLLIAVSEFTRQQIIQRLDWPAERVVTVLQGVGPEFGAGSAEQQRATVAGLGLRPNGYVLCVSTIEPRKNLDRLIEAYRMLPDSIRNAYPLVLVGDHGWRSEATHTSIQHGIQAGWLHYFGYLPAGQLPAVMANCALFVYPSIYEGFGLPVIEAMASGAAVLSSDIPPVREFAAEAIRYFDPLETEQIGDCLQNALNDSNWLATAGRRARDQVAQYTWQATIEQTVRAYRIAIEPG
mgnify:CR=1 FL=1